FFLLGAVALGAAGLKDRSDLVAEAGGEVGGRGTGLLRPAGDGGEGGRHEDPPDAPIERPHELPPEVSSGAPWRPVEESGGRSLIRGSRMDLGKQGRWTSHPWHRAPHSFAFHSRT